MTSMPAQGTAVKVNLSRNVLAEMLFPLKKLGIEYVTLSTFGRFDLVQYCIIASKDNTQVKVEWRLEDVALTFVLKQHEWRVIDRSSELAVITSSQPIQMTFVMDSVDMDHQLASHTYGPSLCVLVPPALHISSYLIA
ncbi:uncharacterized protein LOC131956210 [Physella acuta]|uniref:uncharacterized protein LOC131956210 n=1 Tax=Physella acuta TaxID=109671 RepID=UPI0027DC7390|nr:uncharacterized protein LOC131956210 [Physella acuta]